MLWRISLIEQGIERIIFAESMLSIHFTRRKYFSKLGIFDTNAQKATLIYYFRSQ